MKYRLGLDMGTNSIGWAVIPLNDEMEPGALAGMGVRVFNDGRNQKTGESLAVGRRGPRGMRRNRDRHLLRKHRLMQALIKHGLMPREEVTRKELEKKDPYIFRKDGVRGSIPLHHLGRALFHLNERRGFQSNRKAGKNEKEDGAVAKATDELQKMLTDSGARTYGEWLALRHERREPVRIRGYKETVISKKDGTKKEGSKTAYDFYPSRDMLRHEFSVLWNVQRPFWPKELTEEAGREIEGLIFFQRKLKPVKAGKCTIDPSTERAERALPSLQLCRIYQEANALRIRSSAFDPGVPLTLEQRDTLVAELRKKDVSFDQMRKLLKLSADRRFSLESERRPKLQGDETAILLAKKTLWGPAWHKLDTPRQDEIVQKLLNEEDEDSLLDYLTDDCGLSEDLAMTIAHVPLKESRQRISLQTARKLLVPLKECVTVYSDAVRSAFSKSHSDFETGEVVDTLPYYGKILGNYLLPDPEEKLQGYGEKGVGRIANPTVHIALNQLRHVVNAIIRQYGKPSQIVVELVRDLKNGEDRKRQIEKEQKINKDKNDVRRGLLAEQKLHDNYENRLRLRLWEELGADPLARFCPYTGVQIKISDLFSDRFEIDHILPFSRTLDDSPGNKILSVRAANRTKGNQTPWEAMESGSDHFSREQLEKASEYLPRHKAWRLGPGAMERYRAEGEDDFIARQLTDTAYLARVTKQYLGILLEDKRPNGAIWVTPGKLTALLRHGWGLNSLLGDEKKNRTDHRHHAIDAVVIGLTSRSALKRAATANARAKGNDAHKLAFSEPFPGLRDQVAAHLDRITVSHKPDHGLGGALFTETNYGLAEDGMLVTTEPVASMTIENIIGAKARLICNKQVSDELIALARESSRPLSKENKKAISKEDAKSQKKQANDTFAPKLAEWSRRTGVRRLRVKIKNGSYVRIASRKDKNNFYKALIPAEQHHLDIIDVGGKWVGHYVSLFAANNPARDAEKPEGTLIMRLHKNDLIQMDGGRKLRIMGLNPSSKNITAIEHTQGGKVDTDYTLERWRISKLQQNKAVRLVVDPLGNTVKAAPPKERGNQLCSSKRRQNK